MHIIKSIKEMQGYSENLRFSKKRIGVVPTMGYLHEGHLNLIRIAKGKTDIVITTIFVNPTQFAPNEDFKKYPRDMNRDISLCESEGCDVVFAPETSEMYSSNYLTFVEVEKITKLLEGKFRPTHFRGVTTVVAKLFNITKPQVAVFGQKDAQQAIVIKKMVEDLNFDVEIIVAPTVREPDGLARSSRNVYLKGKDRQSAALLFKSLQLAEKFIINGEKNVNVIKKSMIEMLESIPNSKIDYVSFADSDTLEEIDVISKKNILISLAVRIGEVRLIDNILL